MTSLLLLLSACLATWAGVTHWQLARLRRRTRVAFSVIAYWRRMAMASYTDPRGRHRQVSAAELAERIAARPLTIEQQQMMRRVLKGRRNVGGGL